MGGKRDMVSVHLPDGHKRSNGEKKRQPERPAAESLAIVVAPSDKNERRAFFVEAVVTIENACDHASMHFDAFVTNSNFCI